MRSLAPDLSHRVLQASYNYHVYHLRIPTSLTQTTISTTSIVMATMTGTSTGLWIGHSIVGVNRDFGAMKDNGGYRRRICQMEGFHQLHKKSKLPKTPTSNISHAKAITMANLSSRLRGVRGGYTTKPSMAIMTMLILWISFWSNISMTAATIAYADFLLNKHVHSLCTSKIHHNSQIKGIYANINSFKQFI